MSRVLPGLLDLKVFRAQRVLLVRRAHKAIKAMLARQVRLERKAFKA